MRRKCLLCEGTGVIRTYRNIAGDYSVAHCATCKGTGLEPKLEKKLCEATREKEK